MQNALPPALTGTPTSGNMPVAQQSGNPGYAAQGMAAVRQVVQQLSATLDKFPAGSEPQLAVMECIKKLAKIAPESESSPGIQKTQALASAQHAQAGNPMAALMRAMSGGQQQQPSPEM